MLYFLALAWHTSGGHATAFPLDNLPEPWNWLYYSLHAAAYTAVLFLAGIFGERPKSGKEVILATQRALEQQALERWRMQKEAQIDQMARDGSPLGAIAAALASPETAERIALMEAATSRAASAHSMRRASACNVRGRIQRCSPGWHARQMRHRRGRWQTRCSSLWASAAPAPSSGTGGWKWRPMHGRPEARGRTWTAADYAARDAARARLGLPPAALRNIARREVIDEQVTR